MKGEQRLWQVLNDKLEMLRASRQWAEAVRVAESALELAKRTFPSGDERLVSSFQTLGELQEEQGNLSLARIEYENAAETIERRFPPDQSARFQAARRLARVCDQLGEHEAAIGYFERAIAAANQVRDLPFAELGTLLNNAALGFRKAGRAKAAEPYYRHALQLYENQLGPDHPDVASILNNLAVFYTNEKRFTEAENLHQRALAIRERAFPAAHPEVAQSKCNLAVVYHSRGDYERAADLYRESLATWDRSTASPPPDYEIMTANYADLLRALGRSRQADELEARARQKRGA